MLSTLNKTPRFGVRCFASKEVSHGAKARAAMLRGCNQLADAVSVTMGPKGRNVVIDQAYGPPKVTKDGVTVAKAIVLSNNLENLGAELVKQVASKTNDVAGDGTTTATVLARAIFREGCKGVAAGMNPLDIKRGMDAGMKVVLEELKANAKEITSPAEIEQVATIASNGDKVIGKMIADAFARVGKDGTITVGEGKTVDHTLEVVEGMKFDRGYISPYFITNPKTQRVELDNPVILFHDKKISSIQNILPLLESVHKINRPLLIIAEDVDGDALATLVLNKLRGGLNVVAVKAPGFGDHRKAMLQDLAILTGGEVITEDTGAKLEHTTLAQLGNAKKITITKEDTIILDGAGHASELSTRVSQIRDSIQNTASQYEKDKLKERLAKLTGGVAVINVGGGSEVEVGEAKDRLEDALCATRAAVEEGIVTGGGTALLYASAKLEAVQTDNFDQKHGLEILKTACKVPLTTIVNNAGEDGVVVVNRLLSQEDRGLGYNAQSGEYVQMVASGIIDPTKVVRTALADAVSVASLMITTEATVTDLIEEDDEPLKKVTYSDI